MKNKYKIVDDTVIIYLTKKDGTTLECYIDVDDFDKINVFENTWYAKKVRNTYYAIHEKIINKNKIRTRMHRVIMDTPVELMVDHQDRNGLNNRKINLKNCTNSENQRNVKGYSNTGYRNVYWSKQKEKYEVKTCLNRKMKSHGLYKTLEEALVVANKVQKEYGITG